MKQQYGIHLATRLQADGDGKEAKWADIDDDEDDWAPETIEWNDGTKITLSHNDPAAALAEEQAAAVAQKEEQEEQDRSQMPPPKLTTTVGPNATVLRLGSGGPPRTGGLVLKNPSDKPTLVAKPSAPTPVRSPWAQLPPVDKVPPIPINLPAQSPAARFQQPDSHGADATQTPTSTAMEIAADSFTRTRRDTQNGSHGQLYNSQSGQYETVNARRGSVRKEQNFRPPALLQRPSPNEQHGPAEPSAAFQTHRSGSQQDGNMWNRRASSSISADSGTQGRRASMSKGSDIPRIPHELLQQRRESQPLQSPLTPGPGQGRFSQHDNASTQGQPPSLSQPAPPLNSRQITERTAVTSAQQLKSIPYGASAVARTLSDVAAQKELMREKREIAVRRKQEEEEREEAERKERIRLKMETLGMAPLEEKKKKETEKVSPGKEAGSKEVERKKVESANAPLKEAKSEKPQALTQPPEVAATIPRSPPKPPVLDGSGAPKQYGLMKMHGPALTNGVQSSNERMVDTAKVAASSQHLPPSSLETAVKESQPSSPPKTNGDVSNKQVDSHVPPSPETRNQDLFKVPRQQPWKNIQNDNDPYASWNGAGMPTHSSPVGNLWGPPSNFKSLGNGTFDRNVQRSQSRQPPYQDHYLQTPPQPIGPPKHLQRPRESPEPARAPEVTSPTPVVEDFQTIPTFPSSETSAASLINRGNMPSQNNNGESSITPSQPGPASQPKPVAGTERHSRDPEQTRSTLAAWSNFHITSARDDAEKKRQAALDDAAQLAEEARTGIRHEPQLPPMTETWRQVKVDDEAGRRQVISVAKNSLSNPPNQQGNGELRTATFPNSAIIAPAAGVGRGSRFFPGAGQSVQAQQQRAVSYSSGFNRSPSPPPPDSVNHPAYFRDQQRPLVNLPYAKPKPTVKLPPSFATPVHSPVMADVRAAPLRAVSQPLVNNSSWQDRFNGLLGVKKQSPEKKFAHAAEFSATTKVPLEVPTAKVSPPVTLPPKEDEIMDSGEVTSKAIEGEEALFENREFGSLPTVLIPTEAPEAIRSRNGKIQTRGYARTKEVDPETLRAIQEDREYEGGLTVIFIKLMGMEFRKSKTSARIKGYAPQGPPRNNRHPSTNSKPGKGYKSRDSSGSYTQKPAQQNSTQRNPMPNGVNSQARSHFGKQNPNWGPSHRVANAV